ncbi:hypothetical protein [Reyranella sp.]|uniref:hypothetical protein n=1 Tax=Reyranella sp. TaxID=1929291 RepID=UPI0025EF3377|nr:hypothetical protein [Reyranella sp.]
MRAQPNRVADKRGSFIVDAQPSESESLYDAAASLIEEKQQFYSRHTLQLD